MLGQFTLTLLLMMMVMVITVSSLLRVAHGI
jgi:hypothetical protein